MARTSARAGIPAVFSSYGVVLALLLAALAPVASAGAQSSARPSAPRITLTASAPEVAVGERVTLRGRTSAPRGSHVLIQRRTRAQSEFHTVRHTRVGRHGRFSHVARPDAPDQFRVRACVRQDGRRTCSKPVLVHVTQVVSPEPRWYYLHDKGPVVPAAGEWCERPETLGGVVYAKSVAFGANCHDNDENYGELALDGACTAFEAVIGLADASTEDSRYDVHVRVDGVEVYGRLGLARTQAEAVSLDLTGAQRLRLEGPFVAGHLGNVVFGDARVFCDF